MLWLVMEQRLSCYMILHQEGNWLKSDKPHFGWLIIKEHWHHLIPIDFFGEDSKYYFLIVTHILKPHNYMESLTNKNEIMHWFKKWILFWKTIHGVLLTFVGKKPINAWWVYKIKSTIDKKPSKFKTHLMAIWYIWIESGNWLWQNFCIAH
jgi:hypothetical protein